MIDFMEKIQRVMVTIALALSAISLPFTVQCYAEDDESRTIMVSLGDSFSSGEGVEPFYGQDKEMVERVKNPDWLAHRSKEAWSGKLLLPTISGKMSDHKADENGGNWYFVASSGAVTANLNNKQEKAYDRKEFGIRTTHTEWLDPQLEIFGNGEGKVKKGEADYVTLSIGGNDVGFTETITECVTKSTAAKHLIQSDLVKMLEDTWNKFDYGKNKDDNGNYYGTPIKEDIRQAYRDVCDAAGSQAAILVAGYPLLLEPPGNLWVSDLYLSADEIDKVNEAVDEFNNRLAELVEECRKEGMNIHFVDVRTEFSSHGAGAIEPYLNSFQPNVNNSFLGFHSQDLKDFTVKDIMHTVASSYSFHPNKAGTDAYARCVQRKIDELEGITSVSDEYATGIEFSVRDENNDRMTNVEVIIEGKEYYDILHTGLFKKDYSSTFSITEDADGLLKLPVGDYSLTVNDMNPQGNSVSKDIHVRKKSKYTYLTVRMPESLSEPVTEQFDSSSVVSSSSEWNDSQEVQNEQTNWGFTDEEKEDFLMFIRRILNDLKNGSFDIDEYRKDYDFPVWVNDTIDWFVEVVSGL